MSLPFRHQTRGRSLRTALAVAAALVVLIGLYLVGTLLWLLAVFSLFLLPALLDLLRDPKGHFELTETDLKWDTPRLSAALPVARIAKARFDTRWDFSVRVTLILHDGKKLRIPQDVLPPHQALENAFKSLNIPVERHHFRVI
ncbi:hypothetical protein [Shimia aestuarii]|uniref:hypothetical protein n=1 Tax=Shimia aestuarii TaxID=254406 RepID=UPI001FB29F0C|nr:hypothetical protein [Shimia aestuarii]